MRAEDAWTVSLAAGMSSPSTHSPADVATYSFFPTENVTIKLKLMNLLDEAISIEREGVLVRPRPWTPHTSRNVVPASSSNVDLRADWFFDNGNSFTVSLFNKEIDKPIEFFEKAASKYST